MYTGEWTEAILVKNPVNFNFGGIVQLLVKCLKIGTRVNNTSCPFYEDTVPRHEMLCSNDMTAIEKAPNFL